MIVKSYKIFVALRHRYRIPIPTIPIRFFVLSFGWDSVRKSVTGKRLTTDQISALSPATQSRKKAYQAVRPVERSRSFHFDESAEFVLSWLSPAFSV
jgi:hypothetical protein